MARHPFKMPTDMDDAVETLMKRLAEHERVARADTAARQKEQPEIDVRMAMYCFYREQGFIQNTFWVRAARRTKEHINKQFHKATPQFV